MAGLDPVAGGAANANIAAIVDAELAALAADAQALQALLSTGDIVQAKVLPPNGLTDLIQILGNRVSAALPPNLVPGDIITVQVTSFEGDRINVQILPDTGAPEQPPLPPSLQNAPSTAVIANTLIGNAPPAGTGTTPSSVAPPPSVFVAAAIQPAQNTPVAAFEPESGAPTPPPVAPGTPEAPPQNTAGQSGISTPGSLRAPLPPPPLLQNIEARLATARAAVIPKGTLPPAPAAPSQSAPAPAASAGLAPKTSVTPPPILNRPFVAPPLVTNARANAPAAPAAAAATATAATATNATNQIARLLTAYQDPATLLRALRLPVTPTNIASARIAIDTPARLPNVLATLQNALPSSSDPRITTLRTLISFVSQIEPDSPVLPAQIAAFVDHVVTGSEPKLAQLLVALRAAVAEQAPLPGAPRAPAAAAPAPGGPTPAAQNAGTQTQAAPNIPTAAVTELARAAERQTAVDFDLKTQLLSIISSPPAGANETLTSAVSSVLTAITALQVNAASTFAANPNGFAFAIPITLPGGVAQANVRIARNAPENARVALDGDNFHIAFILETAHLGTVAIDLRTVGRSVTVDVKAEATLAAQAFGKAMEQLTARLEKLRYRVAKANASVAARGTMGILSTDAGAASAAAPVDPTKLVDRSA